MIPIMKRMIFRHSAFLFLTLFFLGCAPKEIKEVPQVDVDFPFPETGKSALETALKWVEESEEAFEAVKTYTAVYHKEERVDSSKLKEKETILVKFRKPNQIYMKWTKEPNKGMELIYPVKENKLVVEPGGLLDLVTPKMYLNPTDKLAMHQNRHPVTEADIGFFIRRYADDLRKAAEKEEAAVSIQEAVPFMEKVAIRVEVILPEEGYYCARSVVFLTSRLRFLCMWNFTILTIIFSNVTVSRS